MAQLCVGIFVGIKPKKNSKSIFKTITYKLDAVAGGPTILRTSRPGLPLPLA
jgi:hypothetical protein